MKPANRNLASSLILFAAQGFGLGRIPFAPGTFGTLAGFFWIFLLLIPQSLGIYLAGIVAGFFLSVWIGGKAEEILRQKDPGSIVIDEIAALPLAFAGPVILLSRSGVTPGFSHYLTREHILLLLLAFALFRFFDIAKPLGISKTQSLRGGWGLVIDDFLAAALAGVGVTVYAMLTL